NKRLAKAHLEPNPELDKDFIRRETERRARNEERGKNVDKENYEFYDITSWSLPLAFGVEAYWTEDAPPVKGAQINLNEDRTAPAQAQNAALLSLAPLTAADGQPLPGVGGGVEDGRATSAYVIPYGSEPATKLAVALLSEGYKVAITTRQLNA